MNSALINRVVIGTAAFAAGAAGSYYALRASFAVLAWYQRSYSMPMIFAGELLRLGVPLAIGLLVCKWALQRLAQPVKVQASPQQPVFRRWPARTAAATVALLYFITWAFGAPAVATELTNRTVTAFKSTLVRSRAPWYLSGVYPMIKVRVALPLAPGLLAIYYDSATGGQAGGGGWFFYLWWGTGQRQIGSSYLWLS